MILDARGRPVEVAPIPEAPERDSYDGRFAEAAFMGPFGRPFGGAFISCLDDMRARGILPPAETHEQREAFLREHPERRTPFDHVVSCVYSTRRRIVEP